MIEDNKTQEEPSYPRDEYEAWERLLAEAQAMRAELKETNRLLDEMHEKFMAIKNDDHQD